ncbi:hypothetical protein PC128_g16473 [Phytophthora cactorum]|nr:hypothetical protein PC120_g13212 [Phytophthora cactorum]KAG3178275.1 hypothetical protein PC128_g16473 [Phytophthora cactorum]KAG4050888.1 hypothetical protein PC123_g13874 [Phytophthora cactorum]
MNGHLFTQRLRFVVASVLDDVQRPLLLVLDGSRSHFSADIVLEAERLDVLLLFLPANTAHLHQPLDVAVFSTFKVKLRPLTDMHMGETGSSSVDKEEASVMASTAWLECKMGENVKVGFAGCGLFPPSKPRMNACIANFACNGTPATVQLAKWLRIKETV